MSARSGVHCECEYSGSDVTWGGLGSGLFRRVAVVRLDRTPRRGGGWRDHRQVMAAIAFNYRTGKLWMDLPEYFGRGKASTTGCGSGRPPSLPRRRRLARWSFGSGMVCLI
ncbi:hypothetical protein E0L36_22860 [Streptomyces sp. AJS327]|nr:hypothetical protein [Streptomyces sp. AJS327]